MLITKATATAKRITNNSCNDRGSSSSQRHPDSAISDAKTRLCRKRLRTTFYFGKIFENRTASSTHSVSGNQALHGTLAAPAVRPKSRSPTPVCRCGIWISNWLTPGEVLKEMNREDEFPNHGSPPRQSDPPPLPAGRGTLGR